MKNTSDYKSRFRILKGGKISLVVSALLASSVMVTSAHADIYGVGTPDGYILGSAINQPASGSTNINQVNTSTLHMSNNLPALLVYTANSQDSYNNVDLTNQGTLSNISTTGKIEGMVIDAEDFIGESQVIGVTNDTDGVISARATGTANGIAIYRPTGHYALNLTINNAGSIAADAIIPNAKANGIYVVSTNSLLSQIAIANTGTINVSSEVASSEATGINLLDTNSGDTITNDTNGVINAYGLGDVYGIQVGSGSGSIINNGDIYVSSNDPYKMINAIYNTVTGAGNITNSGTIEATLNSSSTVSGMFSNNAIVNGALDYSAYAISTYGSVTNNAFGHINGNLLIAGNLTNAGTISLPYNANSSGSAFIGGNFTNSGTLEIGVKKEGNALSYSQLTVANATFESGSKINVNVLDQDNTNSLLIAGQTVLEGVVDAGTTGSFTDNGLVVEDNSALVDFEKEFTSMSGTSNNPAMLNLKVIQAQTIEESTILGDTTSGGGKSPAKNAARVLDVINGDLANHSQMTSFLSSLNTLGTNAEVARAVESTTPVAATAAVGSTTQIMNGVQGVVEMRQNTTMGTGVNSGDIALRDQNLWIKPFGSRGTQDNKDGMNGFEVKAYGFGMGYDAEVSPKQRLGAAFFYTDADVEVNGMAQSSDVKVYTTLLYGNVPLASNLDFLFQAGYSFQKTESERVILPTYDRATADFTAKTASLDLKLMQTYTIDKDFIVRPRVETTYRHYSNPSYSESGAGAMNLEVEKFTSTQFITGAGMIGEYRINKESKFITDVRLGYDWHHDAQTVTASYQGAAGVGFSTNGIDNGGWQYDIGLGYETADILGGDINFMYNYQGQGSSFDNHVLSAKYVWKF